MAYLVRSGHAQLAGLWLGCVGWTLTAVALGLVQWRVWLVSDISVISGGVAWVGVWRVCFSSHALVSPGFPSMHCSFMGLTDAFTPPDVAAAQVLMLLSVGAGLCGNAGGVYAMRNVHFGLRTSWTRWAFLGAGASCLLAAALSLVPLLWNAVSVATNQTISFPPQFHMPLAPDAQHVGSGIGVGLVGSALMVICGLMFCTYRFPEKRPVGGALGNDNPTFESHEHV